MRCPVSSYELRSVLVLREGLMGEEVSTLVLNYFLSLKSALIVCF